MAIITKEIEFNLPNTSTFGMTSLSLRSGLLSLPGGRSFSIISCNSNGFIKNGSVPSGDFLLDRRNMITRLNLRQPVAARNIFSEQAFGSPTISNAGETVAIETDNLIAPVEDVTEFMVMYIIPLDNLAVDWNFAIGNSVEATIFLKMQIEVN
jgi:hypothetical protein